ncbi:MAG: hypothetical protein IJX89_04640 [Alphaproteobacteria bacterium]|nr:hypothetical protein [Alphaproteobacteria bacterium]
MKKFFIVFLMFCGVINYANAKIQNVGATGYGKSEYEATIDAIDNAIRQTSVVSGGADSAKIVSADYHLEDTREIKAKVEKKSWFKSITDGWFDDDKQQVSADYKEDVFVDYKGGKIDESLRIEERNINQKYQGKIEGYSVKSVSEKKGKYTVEIEAKVFVTDDYVSPDLVKKSKYSVVITGFEGKKKWDCLTDADLITAWEKDISRSKKLTVVDRSNFDKQAKELGLLNDDIAKRENLNKLKQLEIADYLLVGRIERFNINRTDKTIQLTGEKVQKTDAKLTVSYKLIETATMEIVSTDSVSKSIHYESGASCNTVENALVKKVSDELMEILISDISK